MNETTEYEAKDYVVTTPRIRIKTAATFPEQAIRQVADFEGCPKSCCTVREVSPLEKALRQVKEDIELYLSGEWGGSDEGWRETLANIDEALTKGNER